MKKIIFLFILSVSFAHAYVPPTFHVVNTIAQKHSGLKKGKLTHKVTVFRGGGEIAFHFNETLIFKDETNVYIRLSDENNADVLHSQRDLSDHSKKPLLYDLLFTSHASVLFDQLKLLGLPLKTQDEIYGEKDPNDKLPFKLEDSLSFVGFKEEATDKFKFAQVIRDSPNASIQLWVEKEEKEKESSLLPIKVLVPPFEFQMSKYQAYAGAGGLSFIYPTMISVFRNGVLWLKLSTVEVKPGETKIAETKAEKASLDGDAEDFIQQYTRWIR